LTELSESFDQNPQKSLTERSLDLKISRTACRDGAKILNLFPYRITCVQELKESDYPKRVDYCNWFLDFIKFDGILDLTFFTDESWFHLSGYVNSQQSRYWATEKPKIFVETPLHSQKVGVWCAISRRRIVGPIFFENTITSKEYVKILEEFVPHLDSEEIETAFFQQDGAPAHTVKNTAPHLQSYFSDRIISKSNKFLETEAEWPPRSQDLTSPDFFLWSHLKNKVYRSNPKKLEELKSNIRNEIEKISSETLKNVSENMIKRVKLCLENNGQHFQHML